MTSETFGVPQPIFGYGIYCITGRSNVPLAEAVGSVLSVPVKVVTDRFADKEISCQIPDCIRGADVFIIQSICPPDVNSALMEILIMTDAARRASAKRVTAVIPYLGYSRQDRKAEPRTAISAKLVCDLLVTAGVDRVISLELHNFSIQGFFSSRTPLDTIYASSLFASYISTYFSDLSNVALVSPDVGGIVRTRQIAKILDCPIALIDKRRPAPNVCEVVNVIGDVSNKVCVLVDDIVDTANSLCNAASALIEKGALSVFAAVAHAILSYPAVDRIRRSPLQKLFVTDSIPVNKSIISESGDKIVVVSCADLVAKSINVVHYEQSMSEVLPL
ncbi:hypothetical protein RCL1_000329 [Eukaryota sp. TZLM3-RCL]